MLASYADIPDVSPPAMLVHDGDDAAVPCQAVQQLQRLRRAGECTRWGVLPCLVALESVRPCMSRALDAFVTMEQCVWEFAAAARQKNAHCMCALHLRVGRRQRSWLRDGGRLYAAPRARSRRGQAGRGWTAPLRHPALSWPSAAPARLAAALQLEEPLRVICDTSKLISLTCLGCQHRRCGKRYFGGTQHGATPHGLVTKCLPVSSARRCGDADGMMTRPPCSSLSVSKLVCVTTAIAEPTSRRIAFSASSTAYSRPCHSTVRAAMAIISAQQINCGATNAECLCRRALCDVMCMLCCS